MTMLDLTVSTAAEIRRFGQQMRLNFHDEFESMEDAAQAICHEIYQTFRRPTGEPTFALVRIFRLGSPDELPPRLAEKLSVETETVLTLMGTAGLEDAWNDRHQSQNHAVLPVDDNLSPMFKAAFQQTGLDARLSTELTELSVDTFTNYFHVEEAPENPAIPRQTEFVEPYGVQSMLGFASRFISGAAYLAVGFSIQHLKAEDVRRFGEISVFMSTLLAAYDGRGMLWNE
jgi:hypothetical protein